MSVLIGAEEAIEEIKRGRIVILADDQCEDTIGSFTVAAEKVTADTLNFIATHGKGRSRLAVIDHNRPFEMTMMVSNNGGRNGSSAGVSYGIPAEEKTSIAPGEHLATILTVAMRDIAPRNVISLGQMPPLSAHRGGVLAKPSQAEASVDLARLAGFRPAGVLCEVMTHKRVSSKLRELANIAEKLDLKICTIKDLIKYRLGTERLVRRSAQTIFPTEFGADFILIVYENDIDERTHVALVMGEIDSDEETLVRVHSECLTGDVFGSRRCDCGPQLNEAMRMISMAGKGVILYMQQEGRGIGLLNKIKAYALQDQGYDTVEANLRLGFEADLRDYSIAAQMLTDLGVRQMRLMTNNPDKINGLQRYGLETVEQVPIVIEPCETNACYLRTKRDKMGHLLELTIP